MLNNPGHERTPRELAIEGASVFESLEREGEEEVMRSLDPEDASWPLKVWTRCSLSDLGLLETFLALHLNFGHMFASTVDSH